MSSGHKAFTLIEMLISLAIVSCIVTMVYGSYAATSRSLGVYHRRMACSERAHLVLRLMARQIRGAYMSPAEPTPTRTNGKPQDARPAPIPAFRGDAREPRGEILTLTTSGGFGLDESIGISRVVYRHDRHNRTLAIRCELDTHRSDALQDPGAWRIVLKGVTDLELGFYDGRQWQRRWDSKQAGRLPQAVKIDLVIVDENGREHHYATTVPVLCRPAPKVQQVKTPVREL